VRGNFGQGGVVGLGGGKGRVPLRDGDITVAEILQAAGYVTGITGKWGLGEPETEGIPTAQGFDHWFGYLNQRRAHSYYPEYMWMGRSRFPLPGNLNGNREQYSHDLCTGFALNFIQEHHRKPFFLYVPYTIPHDRFEVPSLGRYADKPWKADERAYAAMITRMDAHLGSIFTLLKNLEIDKNTIVFFCSDNGAANRYEGLFNSSGPLRGRKRELHEGGIRTPMIVRWPDKIAAGVTSDTAWTFADFLPTAAEIAAASPTTDIDGTSILPTMMGEEQRLGDRFLYWEFGERGFQQAVRWRDWKAIRKASEQPLELYDLAIDLSESNNIASQHADVIHKIESFLKNARTESTEFPSSR
jgi:arylsulfatase A-like enzyme